MHARTSSGLAQRATAAGLRESKSGLKACFTFSNSVSPGRTRRPETLPRRAFQSGGSVGGAGRTVALLFVAGALHPAVTPRAETPATHKNVLLRNAISRGRPSIG